MIHSITANVPNTAIYYGAKLYSDKDTPPKTEVTNSSASAAARGNNEKLKTGVTFSSAREAAVGAITTQDSQPQKNVAHPVTIAAATVSANTPSVNIAVTLKAESEKENKDAKFGKTKETPALRAKEALKIIASKEQNSVMDRYLKKIVSAESVVSAYKQ